MAAIGSEIERLIQLLAKLPGGLGDMIGGFMKR